MKQSRAGGFGMVIAMGMVCAGAALAAGEPCAGALPPDEALLQLNALRAVPRACGSTVWPAVAPLQWDERLARSAERFAQELARRRLLSHVGEQQRSLRERFAGAGYPMRRAAENLAGGPFSLDEALQEWLASPDHCENLMATELTDVGLACVATTAPGYERFWVLHLGRSLPPVRSSPDRSP